MVTFKVNGGCSEDDVTHINYPKSTHCTVDQLGFRYKWSDNFEEKGLDTMSINNSNKG